MNTPFVYHEPSAKKKKEKEAFLCGIAKNTSLYFFFTSSTHYSSVITLVLTLNSQQINRLNYHVLLCYVFGADTNK